MVILLVTKNIKVIRPPLLMYTNDLLNSKKFQDRFYRLKESPNPRETFSIIKDYAVSVEAIRLGENTLISNKNPLECNKDIIIFIKELNAYCLDFLVKMAYNLSNKEFSSEAHTFLGLTYEIGLFGISRNIKNAFNYYIVAAKQKNKYGTYRLAQAYEKEMGGKKGYRKAAYFYRCAAKLGCIYGMHTYGSILIRGDLNTEREFDTGLFYLKSASHKADNFYPYPFYDLGQVYESQHSCSEIDSDDDYAFKMYDRGSRLGCPNSQYRLGKCYELGQLFKTPNMRLALEYYKSAADNGHMDAQYLMSRLYFTGIEDILPVNYNESFKYALLSGIRGHPEGASAVGEFIEKGYGIKKNSLLALWWYTISYEFGNTNAEIKMRKIRNNVNKDNIGPSYQSRRICCFC